MENKTPFMPEIPEKEPQRQQYFMAHAKEQLTYFRRKPGQTTYLLYQHLWMSDERQRF